jgi:hypothetical protein
VLLGFAVSTFSAGQNFQPTRIPRFDSFLKLPTAIHISTETVVSGIDVYKGSAEQVLEKLGKPSRTEIIPPPEWGPEFTARTYEWEGRATSLKLTTLQAKGVKPIITSVEVWGSRPDAEVGTTGHGLKLGDSIADARRLYGLRLYFGVTVSEKDNPCRPIDSRYQPVMPTFSPTLSVEFDEREQVNHMVFLLTNECPSL